MYGEPPSQATALLFKSIHFINRATLPLPFTLKLAVCPVTLKLGACLI